MIVDFASPNHRSFTCDLCIHFHNTTASRSSLHNFCCTLKCKDFLVKSKLTDIHCIPDITESFQTVKFLTFSCSITDIKSLFLHSNVTSPVSLLEYVSHRKEALDSPSNHKASEKRNFVFCAHMQADTCVFCACFWLNQCRRVASTSLYEDKVHQYYYS